MVELVSTIAQRLGFCLLTERLSLPAGQPLGSSRVDQSARPVGRLNQLRTKLRASLCGLGVVSDHAGQVVAVENGRVGLVHDQVADSFVEIRVV